MKQFLILLAAIAINSSVAHAQDRTIRSGDHPTFSRITIPLTSSQSWEAKRVAGGIEVSLPGVAGNFDTSTVFTRMRQNRISAVTRSNDKLLIDVACSCDASVFRSANLLVIDVADVGTPLAGPALEGQISQDEARPAVNTVALDRLRSSPLPWIGSNPPSIGPRSILDVEAPDENIAKDTSGSDTELEQRAALLKEVQKSLVEEVGTAASLGLLEGAINPPIVDDAAPATPRNLQPKKLPAVLDKPSKNMRITNSMSSEWEALEGTDNTPATRASCPKEEMFAVETWGTDEGFSAQIGQARNALTDPRDRLSSKAVIKLVETYLYFGFGAEALDALELDASLVKKFQHLNEIAEIFKSGRLRGQNSLGHFSDCPTNVALWAALSFETIPPDTVVNDDAALRALNKLPSHLRQIIAPQLSKKLLKYGKSSAAEAAMRSIQRLPDAPSPEALMMQSDLALDAGLPADTLLEEVIDTNTENSPIALIKLIDSRLENNEPLSSETTLLLEAFAQEYRGTELGRELKKTQIYVLSASGSFSAAFLKLDDIAPAISDEVQHSIKRDIFKALSRNGDDIVFLEQILSKGAETLNILDINTSLSISRRLLNLGFPSQAQEILSTIPETSQSHESSILKARAAIQLQNPLQAQIHLTGIQGQEAELLLAQVKEMIGAFRDASEIYSNIDAAEKAAQAAWLSDDWRDIISSDEPNFGPIANLDATPKPVDGIGMLSSANNVLEESGQVRSTLRSLLSDPALQVSPNF